MAAAALPCDFRSLLPRRTAFTCNGETLQRPCGLVFYENTVLRVFEARTPKAFTTPFLQLHNRASCPKDRNGGNEILGVGGQRTEPTWHAEVNTCYCVANTGRPQLRAGIGVGSSAHRECLAPCSRLQRCALCSGDRRQQVGSGGSEGIHGTLQRRQRPQVPRIRGRTAGGACGAALAFLELDASPDTGGADCQEEATARIKGLETAEDSGGFVIISNHETLICDRYSHAIRVYVHTLP